MPPKFLQDCSAKISQIIEFSLINLDEFDEFDELDKDVRVVILFITGGINYQCRKIMVLVKIFTGKYNIIPLRRIF